MKTNLLKLVVMISLTILFSGCVNEVVRFKEETKKIKNIFPYFEKIVLKTFRYQERCKCISFYKGTFTVEPGTSCTYLLKEKAMPVTEEVGKDISELNKLLRETGSEVFRIEKLKYNSSGKITFGVFEFGKGFSRRYYIFDPGYTLPGDIPYERLHKAIDTDWYYKWEDWN